MQVWKRQLSPKNIKDLKNKECQTIWKLWTFNVNGMKSSKIIIFVIVVKIRWIQDNSYSNEENKFKSNF